MDMSILFSASDKQCQLNRGGCDRMCTMYKKKYCKIQNRLVANELSFIVILFCNCLKLIRGYHLIPG